jgi:hypothetical protein
MESCAPKRNCSDFRLKQGLKVDDLPPFPLADWISDEMTNKERKICGAVYIAILTDHAQGVRREPSTRPYSNYFRNGRFPETIKIKGIVYDKKGRVVVSEIGEDQKSQTSETGDVVVGENSRSSNCES